MFYQIWLLSVSQFLHFSLGIACPVTFLIWMDAFPINNQVLWLPIEDTKKIVLGRRQWHSTTSWTELIALLTAPSAAGGARRNTQRPECGRSTGFTASASASPSTTTSIPGNTSWTTEHTALEVVNKFLWHLQLYFPNGEGVTKRILKRIFNSSPVKHSLRHTSWNNKWKRVYIVIVYCTSCV